MFLGLVNQFVAIMATGRNRPGVEESGRDPQGRVHVPWSTLLVGVTLGSAELYNLDTKCVPKRSVRLHYRQVLIFMSPHVVSLAGSCSLLHWRY